MQPSMPGDARCSGGRSHDFMYLEFLIAMVLGLDGVKSRRHLCHGKRPFRLEADWLDKCRSAARLKKFGQQRR